MALHGKTPGKVCDAVRELKPFRIGNVRGSFELHSTGRLPEEYAYELSQQAWGGRVKYVLYSYSTPMAWLLDGEGWVRPLIKYSVTTSGHQSVFDRAIGVRVAA